MEYRLPADISEQNTDQKYIAVKLRQNSKQKMSVIGYLILTEYLQ